MKKFLKKSLVIFIIYTVIFTSVGYGCSFAYKNINYKVMSIYNPEFSRTIMASDDNEKNENIFIKFFKIGEHTRKANLGN